MSHATLSTNGRLSRPSLSNQIDRLDHLLDGLADALNESVADAVRSVVGQVVKESIEATLREVVTNPPDLQAAALTRHALPPTPPPAPPRKTLVETLRGLLISIMVTTTETAGPVQRVLRPAWSWTLAKLRWLVNQAGATYRSLAATSVAVTWMAGRAAAYAWQFRQHGVLVLAAGAATGVAAYAAGPIVAGLLSGLSGAAGVTAGRVLPRR
ncbi:MAG: hypothetical protein U0840_29950 [Gemmataceae bacterium]